MSNFHVFKTSTSLKHCDYDEEKQILTLCFQSGGTHEFHKVPKHIYENIKTCKSAGQFFHSHIRDKFKNIKV